MHDRKPNAADARLSFMVRLLVALVAGVSLPGAQCARTPTEPPFTMKQIAPNAWAAIDNPKSPAPATSNAGFVEPLAKDSALQTEAEVRGTKRIPTQQRGG